MKYCPLVSIVIPVYNGSNYLKDAIDSALAQTYKNIEILVINDGSDDEGKSEKVALGFGDKIKYFSKENGGVSSALNLAIENMSGEWLSWLSHDDLYLPDKIEFQVKLLNKLLETGKYPDITKLCLYGATERINADGNFISRRKYNVPEDMSPKDSVIFNIKSYSIGGCTVLMSKKILDEVGGFDVDIRTVSDADLWFRIMRAGYPFVFNGKVIVQSRQHKEQVGNKSMSLFEKEHTVLIDNVSTDLLNDGLNKSQKYGLLEGLVVNGYFKTAKKVKTDIKNSGQYDVLKLLYIDAFLRIKRFGFVILRNIYRKITLR